MRASDGIFKLVAEKVVDMWVSEGIPLILTNNVQRKVAACYKNFRNINKVSKTSRDVENPRVKKAEKVFGELFDIALCKCRHLRSCGCPPSKRVPQAEIPFLQDQRGPRKMTLGAVDRQETSRREAAALRRRSLARNEGRAPPAPSGPCPAPDVADPPANSEAGPSGRQDPAAGVPESADDSSSAADTDEDWRADASAAVEGNADTLTHTALATDRYGLSNRAVAAVLNAFQQDIGRISSSRTALVVDPMKIWRERHRMRQESAQARDQRHMGGELKALYFDGRHDQTRAERGADTETVEHVAVVAEPGSEYVTHFTPLSGKAYDQVNELVSIANAYEGDVRVLGCDGAAVNTGRMGGVCRLFELIQERPVHWHVCMLHANELILRELFQQLDGKTTGPKSFNGPLGKAASGAVHRLPVVQFSPVAGPVPELPETAAAELSTDQLLLIEKRGRGSGLGIGYLPGHISMPRANILTKSGMGIRIGKRVRESGRESISCICHFQAPVPSYTYQSQVPEP